MHADLTKGGRNPVVADVVMVFVGLIDYWFSFILGDVGVTDWTIPLICGY